MTTNELNDITTTLLTNVRYEDEDKEDEAVLNRAKGLLPEDMLIPPTPGAQDDEDDGPGEPTSNYDPSQPRDPGGEGGGQWVKTAAGGGSVGGASGGGAEWQPAPRRCVSRRRSQRTGPLPSSAG